MNIALECEVAAAGLLVVVFDLISALILLLMILITGVLEMRGQQSTSITLKAAL
jgi:hypothetical protein